MARSRLALWLPVALWAAVIFVLSAQPDLSTGLGTWDLILRKLAHVTEYAVLGVLLMRALTQAPATLALGLAYAVSDEIHQHFVRGRHASPLDVGIDAVGLGAGIVLLRMLRRYASGELETLP